MFSSEFEKTQKTFIEVRDCLLAEMRGDPYSKAARAYRRAFSKPLLFYKGRTVEESISLLKAEVERD